MSATFSKSTEKGKNISYIGMSWAFATLIYLPIQYAIHYINWYTPLLVLGCICIASSILVYYGFKSLYTINFQLGYTILGNSTNISDESNLPQGKFQELHGIFTNLICSCILWSHTFAAIACGSIETAISGPWLEDVYGWSVSETGYIGFVIFAGESCGTLLLACLTDKYGVWRFAFIAHLIFFLSALLIFLLSYIYLVKIQVDYMYQLL